MELIERIARTGATLSQPTGSFSDGAATMAAHACKVCGYGEDSTTHSETGQVVRQRTFLVAPLGFEPLLPAALTVGGVAYNVAAVKTFRDMHGNVVAHRVTVAV